MNHHEFSPSHLEQYRLCPGSYIMQKGLTSESNEWAKEGQMLHAAVVIGDLSALNDEQKTTVQKCIDFLKGITEDGDKIYYEHPLTITDSITGEILTEGIADVIVHNPEKHKLIVIDWKYGFSEVSEADGNIQIASYSLGAMQMFKENSCKAIIYQPRIHKKSEYEFSNANAIEANIRVIIHKATGSSIILKAGEKACRYCLARLNCPAFRVSFQKLLASGNEYDLTQEKTLEELYDKSKVIKSLLQDIENSVKNMIEKTGKCGRYIFKVQDGSREIKDLNTLYDSVKDYITPQEFNNACKVSVAKIEAVLSDKLIAEAEVRGEKLTKTEAKKRCYDMIGALISRGNPINKIVENVA